MSDALAIEIRAMIEADGPISVERYMALCLQHPVHGYYTTRDSIGRSGDFHHRTGNQPDVRGAYRPLGG